MHRLRKEFITESFLKQSLPFESCLQNMQIKINTHTPNTLNFELINVDVSIANSIRRILLSEIPTMAFHTITIKRYDTVMPEEIFCHRLGLIPILADPTKYNFKTAQADETNTLIFKLNIDATEDMTVYSHDLVHQPFGTEIISVQAGIPLIKLCKGQYMEIELQAEKNTGKEHAKWSAVSLASYRMMNVIVVNDVEGEDAIKLQKLFTKGVIEIVDNKAVVVRPEINMSTEVLNHEIFNDRVILYKKKDHFIFDLESVSIDCITLLKQAIFVFKEKCRILREEIENYDNEED